MKVIVCVGRPKSRSNRSVSRVASSRKDANACVFDFLPFSLRRNNFFVPTPCNYIEKIKINTKIRLKKNTNLDGEGQLCFPLNFEKKHVYTQFFDLKSIKSNRENQKKNCCPARVRLCTSISL